VKNVGEPCAGKSHARFDVGGGRKPGQSASPCGPGASRRPYLDCARSSVTDELMGACDQANLLGPGFFGCLQEIGMEEQISIEPLPADDSFVFLTLDIQTERP